MDSNRTNNYVCCTIYHTKNTINTNDYDSWSIALVLYIHLKYSKVDSKKKEGKLGLDDEDP